jgi:hypothetical protein
VGKILSMWTVLSLGGIRSISVADPDLNVLARSDLIDINM